MVGRRSIVGAWIGDRDRRCRRLGIHGHRGAGGGRVAGRVGGGDGDRVRAFRHRHGAIAWRGRRAIDGDLDGCRRGRVGGTDRDRADVGNVIGGRGIVAARIGDGDRGCRRNGIDGDRGAGPGGVAGCIGGSNGDSVRAFRQGHGAIDRCDGAVIDGDLDGRHRVAVCGRDLDGIDVGHMVAG